MKVICISGKAQHGKDTTSRIMASELRKTGFRVLEAHYADLVKYTCRTFFGWNGEKDEAGRTMLQRVGTDAIRTKDPDYWVRFIADILRFFPDDWDYVLIPDARFPNEIDYMKECGLNTLHVRVIRPNFESNLTEEQKNHPSETALDAVKADFYIYNQGTEDDLKKVVCEFIKENLT